MNDGLEPLPASLARTWGNTETMEGRLMSEGGEARCFDCGKTPETCWLPPHLCKHPDRKGGEAQARNHEAEQLAAEFQKVWPWGTVPDDEGWLALARLALDAVRRSPQGEEKAWRAAYEDFERTGSMSELCRMGEATSARAERLRVFARNLPKSASETYRQAFFDAAEVAGHNPSPERNTEKLVEALALLREVRPIIGSDKLHGRVEQFLAEFSDASKKEE